MGSNYSWKTKQSPEDLKRKKEFVDPLPTFLIVCEGKKTEPNYFESFKLSSAKVKIHGEGKNTISLVEETIDISKKYKKIGESFDQIWVVFDRDSFSDCDFNKAIADAQKQKLKVAYSNEAFELWYLLHFHYYDTGIGRDQYKAKLTKNLGHEYKKNSTTMYEEILDKQATAIRNAKKLLESFTRGETPSQKNPSTTVFVLVEELNKYLKT